MATDLKNCPHCPRRLYTTLGFLNHLKGHGYEATTTATYIEDSPSPQVASQATEISAGDGGEGPSEHKPDRVQVCQITQGQGLAKNTNGGHQAILDEVQDQICEFDIGDGNPDPDSGFTRSEQDGQLVKDGLSGFPLEAPLETQKRPDGKNWPVACEKCFKLFQSRATLRVHFKFVHEDFAPFKCETCSEEFVLPGKFRRHLKLAHKSKKTLKCEKCHKVFRSKVFLEKHLKATHECGVCSQEFQGQAELKSHKRTAHNEVNPNECEKCRKEFRTKSLLQTHKKSEHDPKPSMCSVCHLEFENRSELKWHRKLANCKSEPQKCQICFKEFVGSRSLRKHIKVVHEKVKLYKCEKCPFECSYVGDLNRHMLAHERLKREIGKSFQCEICFKEFVGCRSLRKHIKVIHEKVEPYKCDKCPYECSYIGYLNRHMLAHERLKREIGKVFQCEICFKVFVGSRCLRKHIKVIHEKVKPYKCEKCPYKCSYVGDLNRHIRVHEKLKQESRKVFPCETCTKGFQLSSSLKRHRKSCPSKS